MMQVHVRQGFIATGTAALTVGIFLFDVLTPLGLTNQVLYVIPLLLSFLSANTTFPFVVGGVCSLLVLAGFVLSPDVYDIPQWVIAGNRLFSLMVVWTPVLYYRQRRKHEEALLRMNEALEIRVQERTKELASVNNALVAEVSERMDTERLLDASRQELRQLASQLLRVQEAERRRISRDLHDDINQRLALLAVDLDALEREFAGVSVKLMREIRAIQERVIELSEDVRLLAYQFHPSILDDLGLSIALQRLIDDFAARTGIVGRFLERDGPVTLMQDVATCLYRVAQESLGNVARHAKAEHVVVELIRSRSGIQLTVSDDGKGFDAARIQQEPRGLGLLSMKERMALVDGTLDLSSAEGKGASVCAWAPLPEDEAQ